MATQPIYKYKHFRLIDYVKILLINIDIDRLSNLLEFKRNEVNESTGEYSLSRTTEHHFCKIVIYDSGIVLFTGSIHKLWNSLNNVKAPNFNETKNYKGFNGNQFTINNIIEVKEHLQSLFDCKPNQMTIQNIELGVNTTPLFNPNLYLKGLLYHKNILFEYRYNGNLAQAEHQRFIFKIYNKSIQYGMNEFTLRIELKINKTEELKSIGLRTFEDININTLEKAKQMLLKRFDEVMHFDYSINKKELTKNQIKILKSYSNPRYWIIDLKPQHRHRHKIRLQQITFNHSQNLHQHLRDDIIKKCVIINRKSEKAKCVIINSSSIGLNITQLPPKKCPITGIDLNHEKEGSIYIKTKTLNYLFKNDILKFQELCSLLLNKSKGSKPKFEQDLIKHLAKQIRNRFYNQLTIRQTGYKTKIFQNQLFLSI